MTPLTNHMLLRRQPSTEKPCTGHNSITLMTNSPPSQAKQSSQSSRTTSSSSSPALLLFFILLALNCVSSSLQYSSLASHLTTSVATFSLLQPCLAARNINSNQRVDAPSPDDYPPLEGPDFAFTQWTPLGALSHPREYADGALATQKLVAAPLIPLNRQMWPGVDTRPAYFGNNFGGEKIANVSQLLQAGMRRLVLDLWWDGVDLGWQLCPRIKRSGAQLSTIRLALENMEKVDELQLQGMGLPDQILNAQDLPDKKPLGASDTLSEEAGPPKVEKRSDKKEERKGRNDKKGTAKEASTPMPEWFRRKRPHHRSPPIRPKARGKDRHHKSSNTLPTPVNREATAPHRGGFHRLAVSKGIMSAYDKAKSADQTVDGITCSTGEDVVMLLETIQSWIQQSSKEELEDVIVLVLNLNELTNSSLGSRTPSPPPTPPPTANHTTAAPMLSNEEFFAMVQSPNTNNTIKAALPNMISLKEIFLDTFKFMIYSPYQLESDRQDLKATWWKSGPVGIDYYNTTVDPVTGRTQTTTGWPTSDYLTDVINRRIIVGFGANNLKLNTTYNIADDFTTIYRPGFLGPSMTNSSLIKITSSLNREQCNFPMPGMMMQPTGREENWTSIQEQKKNLTESITTEVSWSFASMSDANSAPWTYSTGQLATVCGLSPLVEGVGSSLSYSEQAAMTIWSWDLDQPPIDQIESRDLRCGAMQSNGRWTAQDCNTKLPVACRKNGTSSSWIIYEKGANNYRDVTCPEEYQFDVPRTARENQLLYQTLLSYLNETNPSLFNSLMTIQSYDNRLLQAELQSPYSSTAFLPLRRRHEGEKKDGQDEETDDASEDEDREPKTRSRMKKVGGAPPQSAKGVLPMPARAPTAAVTGQGLIWIDISSWQTAGCWVPGGVYGQCPYQDPDNTVALQEIIKVSSIGGVIILVLVGMFLYLKCRRNVRLRKANKRRSDVRTKIMRTEVETVPA